MQDLCTKVAQRHADAGGAGAGGAGAGGSVGDSAGGARGGAASQSAASAVPDEFLDPITAVMMSEPVTLPESGITVDRATIEVGGAACLRGSCVRMCLCARVWVGKFEESVTGMSFAAP